MTTEADDDETVDWGDGGPSESEAEIEDVLSEVETVKEEVSSLAGVVHWAVLIWSAIGGIWLYKHW